MNDRLLSRLYNGKHKSALRYLEGEDARTQKAVKALAEVFGDSPPTDGLMGKVAQKLRWTVLDLLDPATAGGVAFDVDTLAEKIGLTPEQIKRGAELTRKVAESEKLRKEMTPEEIDAWAGRLAADSVAIGEADAWAALGYSIPPGTTSLEHALEEGKCVGCSCTPDGWSYVCSQCLRPTTDDDDELEWDLWNEWGEMHAEHSCPGGDTCATAVREEGSEIRNRCVLTSHAMRRSSLACLSLIRTRRVIV